MAAFVRRKLSGLIEDAIENASQFEFFQLVRLLEEGWHGHGRVGEGLDAWLRMRPASEISFPAADIRRCVRQDDGKLELQLNFMGLYGVDTVLPQYFSERIARSDETSEALRAFLDIFSHRFYVLFYRAWMKFRPYVDLQHSASEFAGYLAGLAGAQGPVAETDLAYCGVLGARVRGGGALAEMLETYLNGWCVEVRQFVPRWVNVGEPGRLGYAEDAGLQLSHSAVLGEQVLDLSGKIEVRIGPVGAQEALCLLPGGERASEFSRLIRRYLEPTLRFDVVLQVRPDDTLGVCLGSEEASLGRSTWLGGHNGESYALRIQDTGYFRSPAREMCNDDAEGLRKVA